MLVKNVNGTARFEKPKGYDSWLDYWRAQTGKEGTWCVAEDCFSLATVGAHVQKVNSSDKKYYIVPLCSKCNKRTDSFEVRDDYLVPVPSNL